MKKQKNAERTEQQSSGWWQVNELEKYGDGTSGGRGQDAAW